MIGPPTLPPNWFWRSSGLLPVDWNQLRPSKMSLRKNSYADPWK